jgi:DNA-binding beta-propeller fold protein YncE
METVQGAKPTGRSPERALQLRPLAFAAGALLLALSGEAAAADAIQLPGANGGVGFDDLTYSPQLRRMLVPAGRTGRLDLIDPRTGAVESVEGFSASTWRVPGHGQGTTSADAGGGYVFATDRSRKTLDVVDTQARRIVGQIALAAGPDYVRWVEAVHQVWVTEPSRGVIEVFQLDAGPPKLTRVGAISVPDGPESLVFDASGTRAYTNTFGDLTAAVDVPSRSVVAKWRNGCRGARGIALDSAGGVVFAGCDEGKVVALDTTDGHVLGEVRTGGGIDSIAYSPALGHVYAPGGDSATLTIIGVSGRGVLASLGTAPTARGAHCVAPDEEGRVFVCDPGEGRVLVLHDPYPASGGSAGSGHLPRQ